MSGVDTADGRIIRKGAVDSVIAYVREQGGTVPPELEIEANAIAGQGGTPLAVVEGTTASA